jgi:hypothetical protein
VGARNQRHGSAAIPNLFQTGTVDAMVHLVRDIAVPQNWFNSEQRGAGGYPPIGLVVGVLGAK